MVNFISEFSYRLFDGEALFPKIILYDYLENISECINTHLLLNKSVVDLNYIKNDVYFGYEESSDFFNYIINTILKEDQLKLYKSVSINVTSIGCYDDEFKFSIMGCAINFYTGLYLKVKVLNCELLMETYYNSKNKMKNKSTFKLNIENIIIIKEDKNFEKVLENYFLLNSNEYNSDSSDEGEKLAYFVENFLIKNGIDLIFLVGNTCLPSIKNYLSSNGIFVIDYLNSCNYEVINNAI